MHGTAGRGACPSPWPWARTLRLRTSITLQRCADFRHSRLVCWQDPTGARLAVKPAFRHHRLQAQSGPIALWGCHSVIPGADVAVKILGQRLSGTDFLGDCLWGRPPAAPSQGRPGRGDDDAALRDTCSDPLTSTARPPDPRENCRRGPGHLPASSALVPRSACVATLKRGEAMIAVCVDAISTNSHRCCWAQRVVAQPEA